MPRTGDTLHAIFAHAPARRVRASANLYGLPPTHDSSYTPASCPCCRGGVNMTATKTADTRTL
jgi:hypothetical protein